MWYWTLFLMRTFARAGLSLAVIASVTGRYGPVAGSMILASQKVGATADPVLLTIVSAPASKTSAVQAFTVRPSSIKARVVRPVLTCTGLTLWANGRRNVVFQIDH